MNIVLYRIHYGFEYIYQSLDSIYDWADTIIICVSREPWYRGNEIQYLGKTVPIVHPEDIDYHIDKLSKLYNKIQFIFREFKTPNGQWGSLVSEFSSNYVLTMEPDMVFSFPVNLLVTEAKTNHMYCEQIEYWKTKDWRLPQRPRVGPVLYYEPKNVQTRFDNMPLNQNCVKSSLKTENYGFCFSKELMLYKHLLALGFSKQIGDSIPSERWYEDKWLTWTPETTDLEISERHKHLIKRAIPCG